jgi:RNA polymerase sigma factor (sigma-70 family)
LGTDDLISRARAGDNDAFEALTQPYRRELQVHCYRMLGSFQDAEDAMQDMLLSAWQGLSRFEERASLRTWLYRIATNRCLNARRSASRRKAKEWDVPGAQPPEPTRLGDVPWLQPYPDSQLESLTDLSPGPDARYQQTESISLAFVTALQLLPPRQLAALVLRDVLGFHADEVAEMLDSTVESVNSALNRARAALETRLPPGAAVALYPPNRLRRTRSCPSSSPRTSRPISIRCRIADRRRLHLDAATAVRVPGPGAGFSLLRQHLRLRAHVPIAADTSQRPASSRRLRARVDRHQPRRRPFRPYARLR